MSKAPFQQAALGALAAARRAGGPVLACHRFTLPPADNLTLIEMAEGESFRFYWERPKDEFSLAAGGKAMVFSAEGPQRFQRLAREVTHALENSPAGEALLPEAPGPYALGGFSFFPNNPQAGWEGFPPALMVIPEWMVVRQGGQAWGVVCLPARPGANADDLARGLEELAEKTQRLQARAASGVPVFSPEIPPPVFRREGDLEGHRHWLDMMQQGLEAIRKKEVDKVVLARAVELAGSGALSPFGLLRRLRPAYPNCFHFLVDPGQGLVFLGASPERLVRVRPTGGGSVARLGALAGTAPRGEEPNADELLGLRLLSSQKELWEHQLVVNAVKAAVSPYRGDLDAPERPGLLRLNNVQHLYTPFTLKTAQPLPVLELLGRLHPTPAVGGHPTQRALELIGLLERFQRGWYAGPVGWMTAQGAAEFAVALRSGTIGPGRARLFTGAGIVSGSDPETEYFETQLKLQPLLDAMPLG
ncbi:MAG: isochorismate synthase [Deltaproteobacteria bacterium]|nr:isochorismate synthase [Deltaproteobacteria bacterium]